MSPRTVTGPDIRPRQAPRSWDSCARSRCACTPRAGRRAARRASASRALSLGGAANGLWTTLPPDVAGRKARTQSRLAGCNRHLATLSRPRIGLPPMPPTRRQPTTRRAKLRGRRPESSLRMIRLPKGGMRSSPRGGIRSHRDRRSVAAMEHNAIEHRIVRPPRRRRRHGRRRGPQHPRFASSLPNPSQRRPGLLVDRPHAYGEWPRR
jgi:hypothetical protein